MLPRSMHVTAVPNRTSPPAILIRESYREGGQGKDPHHREHHKMAEAEGGALKEAPQGRP